ncbi:hypothetical protein GJ496_010746 [Pomphorhynchus laevis]|nr:hypothetical protein GJ496_010746 [Pomphorhynchus laevis]
MSCYSSVTAIFYVVIIEDIYSIFGPWIIGNLSEYEFGASFFWGVIVNNQFLTADVQSISSLIQLILVQYPLTFAFAVILYSRVMNYEHRWRRRVSTLSNAVVIGSLSISFLISVVNWKSFSYSIWFSCITAFNPWLKVLMWIYIYNLPISNLVSLIIHRNHFCKNR